MTSAALDPGLLHDPRLPQRDLLLDEGAVAGRLAPSLGAGGLLVLDGCTRVRAKYRIGESLRVVYRLSINGRDQLVAARTFRPDDAAAAFGKAAAVAVPTGRFRPVLLDRELDTVWWTFPNDRRLHGLADLLDPTPELAELAAAATPDDRHTDTDTDTGHGWTASEVVELAPGRSATVRAVGAHGATVAYAKAYAPGSRLPSVLAARCDHVAHALARTGRPVASPRALGWCDRRMLLVLEPMPGERWADLDAAALPGTLRRLGEGIAAVHDIEAPPGTPHFGRLDFGRVAHSADLVARARPDVADRVRRLAGCLHDGPPAGEEPVLLHGDCHPKNALFAGGSLALIDLDQAGTGPAAADIGSLLARLRRDELTGGRDAAGTAALVAAFLDGYATVRPLPGRASLRWHTAAALVAEQAMRAVNRVNRPVLTHLDHLLGVAERTLEHGVAS